MRAAINRLIVLAFVAAGALSGGALVAQLSSDPPSPPASYYWISQGDLARTFSAGRDSLEAVGDLPLTESMRRSLLDTMASFQAARALGWPADGKNPYGRCLLSLANGEYGVAGSKAKRGTLPNLARDRGTGFVVILEILEEWPGWFGKYGLVSTLVRGAVREVLWNAAGEEVLQEYFLTDTGGELQIGELTICRELNDVYPKARVGDRILLWAERNPDDDRFAESRLKLHIRDGSVDLRPCAVCTGPDSGEISQIREDFQAIVGGQLP